jgi:hypothetical protein
MTSFITKMTGRPVLADLSGIGVSVVGTGVSSVRGPLPVKERGLRPTQAPAAVVAGQAYAFAAANGAGNQHTYDTWMRAFRGLEPWRDPT